MKTPLTDKLYDESASMTDERALHKALILAGKLEEIARDALQSFECTQTTADYPETHWSQRLVALSNDRNELPKTTKGF